MKKYDVSLAVALYPVIENGEWDGTLSVVLEEQGLEDLDEDSTEQLKMFCGMVATTVKMMNEDPALMMRVQSEYIQQAAEYREQAAKEKVKRYSNVGGNVFQLHATTETEGNA